MVITSLDNSKIVEVYKLFDKKYRKQTGRYVIEGARLVDDAFKYGANIVAVYVRESVASKFNYANQVVVADKVFSKICDTVNNQGVLAVAEKKNSAVLQPIGDTLVLDSLQDPGNVGTLIRSAVACGFTDIYAVNTVDLYSPKVLRSAMSAHFCINLHECENISEAYEFLHNVDIFACDMNGVNVFETAFNGTVALVLGNEGNGLSEYARCNSDKIVSLPMENNFESLNVAVAGSVIMYQVYSKKRL